MAGKQTATEPRTLGYRVRAVGNSRRKRRGTWSTLAFLVVISLVRLAEAGGLSNKLEPDSLRIGYMNSIFADVQPADALAAIQIWAQELHRKQGFEGLVEASLFENLHSLEKALKQKQLDLVTLQTNEYLQLGEEVALEPRFVAQWGSTITEEALLVVHRQSENEELAALEGKRVVIMDDARGRLGRTWLETLLMERGFPSIGSFFGSVQSVDRSSQTVLPVFFRKADACVVPRTGLEILGELNPQLLRDLRIIASSPATLPSVICIRPDYHQAGKTALVDSLSRLHEEPRGQQILTIFKVDKLVPFEASYLESARQLLEQHATQREELGKQRPQREATAAAMTR